MTDWTRPVKLEDVSVAFPADALDYFPTVEEVPDEFRDRYGEERVVKYRRFCDSWFAGVIDPATIKWHMVDGVDGEDAWRQFQAIMRSFAIPKHEQKIAGAAWLVSLWTTDIEWSTKKG